MDRIHADIGRTAWTMVIFPAIVRETKTLGSSDAIHQNPAKTQATTNQISRQLSNPAKLLEQKWSNSPVGGVQNGDLGFAAI